MTDEEGLRASIDQLNNTISDLRVAVGELGVEVHIFSGRSREDREKVEKVSDRVSRLEAWRNKVTGGLVLISAVTVAIGSTVAALILK